MTAKAALSGGLKGVKQVAAQTKLLQALPKLSVVPEKIESTTSPRPPIQNSIEEFGRITSVYPDRNFGFLANEVTGQTLYFNFMHVTDPSLLEDFDSGLVGHKVHFIVLPSHFVESPHQCSSMCVIRSRCLSSSAEGFAVRKQETPPHNQAAVLS